MEAGGSGWKRMEADGSGWKRMEADGSGWKRMEESTVGTSVLGPTIIGILRIWYKLDKTVCLPSKISFVAISRFLLRTPGGRYF
jgi:hypothetical protein